MQRRRLLLAGGALALAGCDGAPVHRFPTIAAALDAVQGAAARGGRTSAGWPLAAVFDHAAQSIEYALDGYPQLKPAWFRASVGPAAFAWFDARGRMRHTLDEPIPGAPALSDDLHGSAARLVAALQRFGSHRGALQPHFAYGSLDKAQYERAHLMHLADHWSAVVPS